MYPCCVGKVGSAGQPCGGEGPSGGWHLESGSNPPTVPAQRPSDVISTYRMAAQAKATGNILTGTGIGAGTGTGGGAKIEAGGSCIPGIWDQK